MSNAERKQDESQIESLPEQQQDLSVDESSQVKGGIIIINSTPSASTTPLATPSVRFFQEVDS